MPKILRAIPSAFNGVTGFFSVIRERVITTMRFAALETAYESVVSWWIRVKAHRFWTNERTPLRMSSSMKVESMGSFADG